MINVDYGIGSSFVINEQIYRGSLYGSGQIGHTIVNPDGASATVDVTAARKPSPRYALKKQRVWLNHKPANTQFDPEN